MRTKETAGNAASALSSENVTAVGNPVTLVVIGCGQRGQVRLRHFYCLATISKTNEFMIVV